MATGSLRDLYVWTFGPLLIGGWIMSVLYGVACAQMYGYYSEYPRDPRWLKGLVSLLWLLLTLHAAFSCQDIYHYVITSAQDAVELSKNYWALTASVSLHLAITSLCFAYFIRLVHLFSPPRWRHLHTLLLSTLVATHIGLGLVTVSHIAHIGALSDIERLARPYVLPQTLVQVIADTAVSLMFCALLRRNRTAFERTKTMISALMLLAIGRGIVTAMAAGVMFLQVAIAPSSVWYVAVELIIAGLYANSILVTLNARKHVLEAGCKASGTSFGVPLPAMNISVETEVITRNETDRLPTKSGALRSSKSVESDSMTDSRERYILGVV